MIHVSNLPTSVCFFLAEAQTQIKGEEFSLWAEFAWIVLPPVIIFFFGVWCKRKMEKLD